MTSRLLRNSSTLSSNYHHKATRIVADDKTGNITINVKNDEKKLTLMRTVKNDDRRDSIISTRSRKVEPKSYGTHSSRSRSSSPNCNIVDRRNSLRRQTSLKMQPPKQSISERLGPQIQPLKRKPSQPRSNKAMELRIKNITSDVRVEQHRKNICPEPLSRSDRYEPQYRSMRNDSHPRNLRHKPSYSSTCDNILSRNSRSEPSTRNTIKKGPRQNSTVSKKPAAPRAKNKNLITKAKSRIQQSRQGLSNKTKTTSKDKKEESSKSLESFIQGILEQPDVQDMITTIAKQSLGTPIPSKDDASSPQCTRDVTRSHCNPQDKSVSRPKSILTNASAILEKANNVCESFKRRNSFTPRKNKFPDDIPNIKYGKISNPEMYCATCKLAFTTHMLKCLHAKSEVHLLATGEWWKSNQVPPPNFNALKKPVNIFCIICWLKITTNNSSEKDRHMQCSKHRKNKGFFIEIFGKLPLHEWVLWETLTQSFRMKFKNGSSDYPEYVHVPRLKSNS